MFRFKFDKILGVFALASTLTLVSCGGGSGVTAGVGGSGIGGTGVTLVRGNVATVVAALDGRIHIRMLAGVVDLFSQPVIAQSGSVVGIAVSGGGQTDITDAQGQFELIDVIPNPNFVLTLSLTSGQPVNLGIGPVPKNSAVQVNNIVIDARSGSATSSSVEVEDNSDDNDSSDNGSGDNGAEDSDSSDNGAEDGDSSDNGAEDGDSSQEEPDEPDEPEDGDSSDNSGSGSS